MRPRDETPVYLCREPVERGISLTGRELSWLLDGIDEFVMQPHATLSYETLL